ncbi:MAG TPA: Holliday junction branch migration protein RuvA [Lachnospiraceae bacterium]|nr:Holliday junction branch migration protein RuvA [Lachnospiraceae bacterium]
MIAFLRGFVAAVYDGAAVIDVGGVGYEVRISGETMLRLAAADRDEEVMVYTYTYLREDQIALYGFMSRDDLDLFKLLITVSGVGPKGGLALLSVGTADDLRFAIMTGDAKMIARAPGVGKRTAERLILDLRDKVSGMYDSQMQAIAAGTAAGAGSRGLSKDGLKGTDAGQDGAAAEAVEALTALGYSRAEAAKAVRAGRENAQKENQELADTESILKAALRFI